MRRLMLVGGVAVLLLAPAGASASGTAVVSGDVFTDRGVWDYQEIAVKGSDAADDITFTDDLAGVTVHDPGVLVAGAVDERWLPGGISPVPICSDDLGTRTCANAPMTCTSGLGAGTCSTSHTNTSATAQLVAMTVDGGPGDDRIVIPVFGLAVSNVADGGPGDDSLDAAYVSGGAGADTLHGGVYYQDRTGGISASDDGVANDGEPGEHDNILAGSGVEATPFADHIALGGDGWAYGNGGDDVITVADGQAHGGAGADRLTATGTGFVAGDDDSISGGDDTIDVRNGVKNLVMCGPGDDTVLADPLDDTSYYGDCEHVTVL